MGLVLNQDRVNLRRAHVLRDAVVAAFSQQLDKAWFAAISQTDEEAEYLHHRYQAMNANRGE